MSHRTFDPTYHQRAFAKADTAAKRPQLRLLLMIACILGTGWPCSAAEDDKEFQKLAKEEVEKGTAVAIKPGLRVSVGSLYVNLGAVAYDHAGSNGGVAFQPMRNQLRLELLRQYAFPDAPDRAAAAPFFDEIERQILRQREIVRAADRPADEILADLRAIDRKIAEQIEAAVQAVARARGLKRAFVERAAHPGFKTTVVAPPGTMIRYTPYLNYALSSKSKHLIDWLTAQNGDTLKLCGRYRFELLRGGNVIDFRVPVILSEAAIRFE